MGSSSFHFLSLAALVITATLSGVSAECETSIPSLISQCSQYVKIAGPEVPPSKDCCDVVKSLDVPCICKFVTPEVEKLISMEKAVFVGRSCGLTIQSGMKCGSYVVPPLARGTELTD
ncbi:hypothetical protein V6N13_113732 [Hibiscus sabdariffa]|uniref:Bifunctional inhibitor/plant lipid transfer protein/seed storage helical domain-containing protein n=1 Tax=Hibiscus sabdariffa TaxID=183260 RepID=A0ABR2U0H2_9ROSI